jgi:tetratricopeptide (TPR) repeat protein
MSSQLLSERIMRLKGYIQGFGLWVFFWWTVCSFAEASVCQLFDSGDRRIANVQGETLSQKAEIYYRRAYEMSAAGDYANAIDNYERGLELNPDHPCINNGLAWLLLTCPDLHYRDLARAVEIAGTSVNSRKADCGPCWDTLGLALYRTGKSREAHSCFQKSLSLAGSPNQEALGNYLASLKFGSPADGRDGKDLYQAYQRKKGFERLHKEANRLLFRRDDPAAAIDYYTVALLIAPEGSARHALHYRRALAWYRLKEFHIALIDTGRAIHHNPRYAPAYELAGDILAQQGLHEEALDIYTKALALRPPSGSLFYNSAVSLFKLHRYEEALVAINRAIHLHPGNTIYRRYRMKILQKQ